MVVRVRKMKTEGRRKGNYGYIGRTELRER